MYVGLQIYTRRIDFPFPYCAGLLHACVRYGVVTTRAHNPLKAKSI